MTTQSPCLRQRVSLIEQVEKLFFIGHLAGSRKLTKFARLSNHIAFTPKSFPNLSARSLVRDLWCAISGARIARELDRRGCPIPETIICDNGPGFNSISMFFWSKQNGREAALHPTRGTNSECVRRELQRQVQTLLPGSQLVREPVRYSVCDRAPPTAIQPCRTASVTGEETACSVCQRSPQSLHTYRQR